MLADPVDTKSDPQPNVVPREVSPPAQTQLGSVMHLLDALNCGVLLLERGGQVVHANARVCAMMRRTRDEIVGRNVLSFYPSPEAQALATSAWNTFDTPLEVEFYLPQPDGSTRPIIISGRVLSRDGPFHNYAVVTLTEFSQQKMAEADLRDQYKIVTELSNTVLEQALALKESNHQLEQRVAERTDELHSAHMEAMYMLAIAAEAKDDDTGAHVRRLERYALAVARRLGFEEGEAQSIGRAAILHDIGKIHVPDDILKKPGPLTDEERRVMQQHTLAGERILAPSPYFAQASRIARGHHENWDGSGYPDGLAGDHVPIEARIVHLVDVFDALTSVRVYKPAWSPRRAAELLESNSGTLFDPDVSRAFKSLILEGEIARLQDPG